MKKKTGENGRSSVDGTISVTGQKQDEQIPHKIVLWVFFFIEENICVL